jgi:hypothetical protein
MNFKFPDTIRRSINRDSEQVIRMLGAPDGYIVRRILATTTTPRRYVAMDSYADHGDLLAPDIWRLLWRAFADRRVPLFRMRDPGPVRGV